MSKKSGLGTHKLGPRHINWDNFKADLEERLRKTPKRFNDIRELDSEASLISDALRDSFEFNCKLKQKRTRVQTPWWSIKLNKLRAETRRLFNKARRVGQEAWYLYKESQ